MGRETFPRPSLPAGRGRVSAAKSACGQGLRTGAHLRCFPSRRCAAGPVHEATGGYAVRSPCPSGIPRPRHKALSMVLQRFLSLVLKRFLSLVLHRFLISSPDLRIDARFSPFTRSFVHRFLISGPDLRIAARLCPFTASCVQRFRISGGKLGNHCKVMPVYDLLRAAIPDFRG